LSKENIYQENLKKEPASHYTPILSIPASILPKNISFKEYLCVIFIIDAGLEAIIIFLKYLKKNVA